MSVKSLLAQYGLVQARIEVLMQEADVAVADLSLLLRRSDEIRDRIVNSRPKDAVEAAEKIACLTNILRRDVEMQGVGDEAVRLLDTVQATCAQLGKNPERRSVSLPSERTGQPGGASVFGGSVAEYVTFAQGRVALIDTNFFYIAISSDHAEFFGRSQVEIMGVHVSDLVGESRFRSRARPRLEACFEGAPQSYHYGRTDGADGRIMRCDMGPVSGSDGDVIGALVYHTDVTEQVRRLRGAGLVITPGSLRRTS